MAINRLDGLSVHDLKVVATLADILHFGETASALGLSQPSVSSAVCKFESAIGFQVFHRTSRRCELTPRGLTTIHRVRLVLTELQFLDPDESGRAICGVIRLGVIPTIAPYLLPWIMEPINISFPKMSIYFTEGLTDRVLDEVGTHRLDVGIVSSYARRPNIESILLFSEPLTLLLPAGHPLTAFEQVPRDGNTRSRCMLMNYNCG